LLLKLLAADDSEVRAAAVFSLGALIQAAEYISPDAQAGPDAAEAHPTHLPDKERLVLERVIIAGLLEVVYDGSPLVRAEVARALARVTLGHSVLFQDAVHAHQKTSARILRAKSSASQNLNKALDAAQSAPTGGAASTASSSGGEAMWAGQQSSSAREGSQIDTTGKPVSSGSLPEHSPGVRMRDDLYEPLLQVGLDKSNLGGVYASADAARVGGGLYHAVVEALCTLAIDFAPQVWKAGRSALEAAHVEMVFIGQRSATAGLASLRPPQSSPQPLPPGAPSVAGSAMSSFLPKSWQSKSWRSFQSTARPVGASSVASSAASSPESSIPTLNSLSSEVSRTSKPPFVLRMLPDSGDLEGTVHRGNEIRAVPGAHLRLGPSLVYFTSCKQYRWPSLPPLAFEERGPAWLRPIPAGKVKERSNMRDEGIAKCRAVAEQGVRMREQVITVNVSAERTTALLLEPFKPLLVTADGEGTVRVTDYAYQTPLNHFSVSPSEAAPVTVKSLYRVNTLYNEVLMCCSGDGMVSVWRDYAKKGRQRLATAWQSVLVPSQGMPCSEATFCYSSVHMGGTLYAAGGRNTPKGLAINAWDLHREYCVSQLGGGEEEDKASCITHLAASDSSPIVYSANASGNVRIFDLRTQQQVERIQPSLKDNLVGMVAEPGGVENQLVLGYRNGTLNFMDCRVLSSSSPTVSLLRSIEGHSKGNVTTLCGHKHSPLVASATTSQVVKVWSLRGQQVGVIRPHSSILGQPIGPATCLAFAPYSLQLASGGGDSICAIYSLELGQ
jgi:regulator-associated protein of mTOR